MSEQTREQRLRAELAALEMLRAESSIFDFDAEGDPPSGFRITFAGQVIRRDSSSAKVEVCQGEQHCELRLPYSYPERPPDIRWTSPIFHPNVSFSGFFKLTDIGMEWSPEITLDIVCERLWDVARLAIYLPDTATNYAALNWIESAGEGVPAPAIPVDKRALRGQQPAANTNVVRYRRRGQSAPVKERGEILYIDENTPLPPSASSDHRPDDGDIFYIGYD